MSAEAARETQGDACETAPARVERGAPSARHARAAADRRRRLALYVLCVGMLMIVLDVTIVNVALPVDPGRPALLDARASRGS